MCIDIYLCFSDLSIRIYNSSDVVVFLLSNVLSNAMKYLFHSLITYYAWRVFLLSRASGVMVTGSTGVWHMMESIPSTAKSSARKLIFAASEIN